MPVIVLLERDAAGPRGHCYQHVSSSAQVKGATRVTLPLLSIPSIARSLAAALLPLLDQLSSTWAQEHPRSRVGARAELVGTSAELLDFSVAVETPRRSADSAPLHVALPCHGLAARPQARSGKRGSLNRISCFVKSSAAKPIKKATATRKFPYPRTSISPPRASIGEHPFESDRCESPHVESSQGQWDPFC